MWSFSSCWMMYNCSTYLLRTYKVKSCSCIIRAQAQDTPSNMHGFASTISNVSWGDTADPVAGGATPSRTNLLAPDAVTQCPQYFSQVYADGLFQ